MKYKLIYQKLLVLIFICVNTSSSYAIELIKKFETRKLSIVIPVKNNQNGIDRLLDSFFATINMDYKPGRIIIVDNNSDIPLKLLKTYINKAKKMNIEVEKLICDKPGPAAARNVGWKYAVSKGADWILFLDSDCIVTNNTVSGYESAIDDSLAYQGSIEALGSDWLSTWYIKKKILWPSESKDPVSGKIRPTFIVTANVLIHKSGLLATGGFNENFIDAAGEDLFLGEELLKQGTLAFALESTIKHDFLDGDVAVTAKHICDFIKRFERYGRGIYKYDKIRGYNAKINQNGKILQANNIKNDNWQTFLTEAEYLKFRDYIFKQGLQTEIAVLEDIDKIHSTSLQYGYKSAFDQ